MKKLSIILLALITMCTTLAQQPPKREFRGVWIHTVNNPDYQNKTTEEMKQHFRDLLDFFAASGNNAIIFQVRPTADAFFISEIEPWSRYLTGVQGQAPYPLWDPLEFMIEETHNRGMEFHTWLNPYRVTFNATEELYENHLYFRRPYLFLRYGGKIYFDPGHPESRAHIKKVVADIVRRYDVDAIHFDDYFYPYPTRQKEFPDEESFLKFHEIDGFTKYQRNDWRRNNVNMLIRDLNDTIKSIKPWVKFGISPFGIWRNNDVDPAGSNTRGGITNYDDLFADVKLWVREGWIDYNVPQLYWHIGHPRADYATLSDWWTENNFGRQLYIGQNIWVSVNAPDGTSQLHTKMNMVRENPNIHGNVWWSGCGMTRNPHGFVDSLKLNYQRYPALIPIFEHIDNIPPAPVRRLTGRNTPNGKKLTWEATPAENEMDRAAFFAVYRFELNEPINIEDATKLQRVVRRPYFYIPPSEDTRRFRYVVTALDRSFNESKPSEAVRF